MIDTDNLAQLDRRIADRLRALRGERQLSLDALARLSGVSRATLSRLENAEVSGTATVLGRLCAAYGIPLSRLMFEIEDEFPAVVRREAQPVWVDGLQLTALVHMPPGFPESTSVRHLPLLHWLSCRHGAPSF